jgi:hypothetical protein
MLDDIKKRKDAFLTMPEITEHQKMAKSRHGIWIRSDLMKLVKSLQDLLAEAQSNGENIDELKAIQHELLGMNQEVVNYLSMRLKGTRVMSDNSKLDLEF